MKRLKIINYINSAGQADYKGLDIDKIVPRTQVYDHLGVCCIVGYDGEYTPHGDIVELTQAEAQAEAADIIANIPKPTEQVTLEGMKTEVESLKAAKEQAEADSINNMIALTELYEMNLTLMAEIEALKGGTT